MAKAAKKLTLIEMAKLDKQFDEKKKVLLVGKYEEEIDMKFRKTKIQLLVVNYLQVLADLKKKEDTDIDIQTIIDSVSLLNALVVKYFTTIEIPEMDNIEKLISVSKILYNIGVLDELFGYGENAFPKEQIDILNDEINKSTKKIGEQYGELMIQATLIDEKTESDRSGDTQESQ